MSQTKRHFTEQELIRRQKLTKLQQTQADPFLVTSFHRSHDITAFYQTYHPFSKEELTTKQAEIVKIAGRIRSIRQAGKSSFLTISDQNHKVQLYARINEIGEQSFNALCDLDLGDIIGVTGYAMKTNTQELTIRVQKWILLSKALKVLPDKFQGLHNVEERYRKRYLDLLVNKEVQKVFIMRTKIIRTIQAFLDARGYLEVETPIMQKMHGGALARPFKTHHNALGMDLYLRIATELHLKRLIVGGLEKVYEIGRLFRNEGIDSSHNPEFTTIELYAAFEDMNYMMQICEELIRECASKVLNNKEHLIVQTQEHEINLNQPFAKVKLTDALKEATGIDFEQNLSFEQVKALVAKLPIELEDHISNVGQIMEALFDHYIEPNLIEPTFIYHYPVEISPLAKRNKTDPRFTDRFELFIAGKEYANAFSELNDPIDQLARFEQQASQREKGDHESHLVDMDYVECLEYGLPPTGGMGIGIDRLVMLLTNSHSIKDVILFPVLKNK